MSDQNNCSICGKRKIDQVGALLLDDPTRIDSCKCAPAGDARVEDDQKITILICRTCQKRINEGRKGSFTQWIFRHDLCSCENPQAVSVETDAAQLELSDKTKLHHQSKEPEIEVDDDKGFPIDMFKPVERIATGGAGRIYKCRNRFLGHVVAIKTLRIRTDDHLVQLQQEARVISRLNHENILKIYDFGLVDETYPFMVIEYITGISLASLLKKHRKLDPVLAARIFADVCDGLDHAHQRGVFHRDISTSNILIKDFEAGAPVAKIIDFGLSMASVEQQPIVTKQGLSIVGTAAYMCPDQIAGERFDARSEIYSLGCVMFEALTGEQPFQGETPMDIIAQHAEKRTPIMSEIDPALPPLLVAIVNRCMEKNKDNRYASMGELRAAILNWCNASEEAGVTIIQTLPRREIAGKKILIATVTTLLVSPLLAIYAFPEWASSCAKGSPPAEMILSKMGNGWATAALGERFLKGNGVKRDVSTAVQLLTEAAAANVPDAQYQLGRCYLDGIGVNSSKDKAEVFFRKAAEQGHAQAGREMGFLTQVYQENSDGTDWFGIAAERGDNVSRCIRGLTYCPADLVQDATRSAWGDEVRWSEKERTEAFNLFRKAAEDGFAEAQFNLGFFYENGIATAVSRHKAKKWYQKAAKQGDADAQYRLGQMFETEDQYKPMISWYRKAVGRNNILACNGLFRCCLLGKGVASDRQNAELWLSRAKEMKAESRFSNRDRNRRHSCKILIPSISSGWGRAKTYGLFGDNDMVQLSTTREQIDLAIAPNFIYGDGIKYLNDVPVRSLVLACQTLTVDGYRNLAKIKSLQHLEFVDEVKPEGLAELKSTQLTTLKIAEGTVDAKTAAAISQIKSLRKLIYPDIIGPEEIFRRYSLEGISTLPKLQDLTFCTIELDNETLKELKKLSNSTIKTLHLKLSKPALKEIQLIREIPVHEIVLNLGSDLNEQRIMAAGAIPSISTIEGNFNSALKSQWVRKFQQTYPNKRLTSNASNF